MADETLHALVSSASVVVDALLGTGLRDAPRSEIARLIDAVRHARGPVLALDLPSGVVADDGRVPGDAVTADCTIAFGFPKLGTLLHPGRARTGRLLTVDIGFPPALAASEPSMWFEALTPEWAHRRRPRRGPETHKVTAGAVLVVAGSEGMAGAALLAARSALRTGAGFLRIAAPSSLRDTLQAALPEAVFVDRDDPDGLADALDASGAVVLGPGMGVDAAAERAAGQVLADPRPTVVDADALTLLARRPDLLPADRGRLLFTPHPGEAARLLGTDTTTIQAGPPGYPRASERAAGGDGGLQGCTDALRDRRPPRHRYPRLLGSGPGRDGRHAGRVVAALLSQGAEPHHAAGIGLVLTARAKKAAAKKKVAKRAARSNKRTAAARTAKKSTAKKSSTKRATGKKSTPARSTAKTAAAKKATAKKATAKKTSSNSKKATPKKPAKKVAAPQAVAKKATKKKAASKKAASKKAASKKAASKTTAKAATKAAVKAAAKKAKKRASDDARSTRVVLAPRSPASVAPSIPIPVKKVADRLTLEQRAQRVEKRIQRQNNEFRQQYKESFEMSWIYHDTALEGVVYTFDELTTAFRSNEVTVVDSSVMPIYDAIRRHKAAIEFIQEAAEKKRGPVNVDLLKRIFVTLHPEEGDPKAIKYRRDVPQHRLYFHEYAAPDKIAYKVRQTIDWVNSALTKRGTPPLRVAAKAHYDLARAYPFTQDSGKVARLFMNFLLMRAGMPAAIIHATERQRYYEALKSPNATLLVNMLRDSVENAVSSIEKLLDEHETNKRGFIN